MATSVATAKYQENALKKVEDSNVLNDISGIIKSKYIVYFPAETEEDYCEDYDKLLSMTSIALKKHANSNYKSTPYLEPSDIEHVKICLNNLKNEQEQVKQFKIDLINDLTNFQRQIEVNYRQRISELEKENSVCAKQMRILDLEKHKLIMDRLSKILWPYNSTTKDYDAKIANLEIKIKRNKTKIEELKVMRPAANEKEVMLYIMHLKEKYTKKD